MPDRRVEINPGEWFMVAENTILAAEYESVLDDVFKIGSDEHRMEYLFTFRGKVNNKNEQGSFTVAMSPQAAWTLVGDILTGLELLKKANPEEPRDE
jgi:hypothetical protein